MARTMGKSIIVKSPEQAEAIHKAVAKGKRLDTTKFNWTPKKSVSEVLNEK